MSYGDNLWKGGRGYCVDMKLGCGREYGEGGSPHRERLGSACSRACNEEDDD